MGRNQYPDSAYHFIYDASQYPELAGLVTELGLEKVRQLVVGTSDSRKTLVEGLGGEIIRGAFVRGNLGVEPPLETVDAAVDHIKGHSDFSELLAPHEDVVVALAGASATAYVSGVEYPEGRLF